MDLTGIARLDALFLLSIRCVLSSAKINLGYSISMVVMRTPSGLTESARIRAVIRSCGVFMLSKAKRFKVALDFGFCDVARTLHIKALIGAHPPTFY
jgi:hypothetical protein